MGGRQSENAHESYPVLFVVGPCFKLYTVRGYGTSGRVVLVIKEL